MSTVQLADVIVPELYADYQNENSPEKTDLFQSGIVVTNPMLTEKAASGGSILDIPFWKDLDATQEPNISTDNPEDEATPNKIGTGMQVARNAFLNNGWSASDLSGELAGSSPMSRISARTSEYWNRQLQRRMVSMAIGVQASNVANDDGDMISDISIDNGDNATAANVFSRAAFTGAAFTLGDAFESTSAISVHSVVYKRMLDNNDIEFVKDSEGSMVVPTFLGRRVILDDGMPVVAGGVSGFKYTSVLFGAGAFGFGAGSPKKPVAVSRVEEQGKGAGIETLWERKTWLMHPFGFKFESASVAGISATNAELADATNWSRVVDRKNVPLAFLVTNG